MALLPLVCFAAKDPYQVLSAKALKFPSCEELFREVTNTSAIFDFSKSELKEITVTFGATVPGTNGGKRHVLNKETGKPWTSVKEEAINAPQGDPRVFIEVMQPRAARLFGFEMLTGNSMHVPDAAEINGAIAKVNSGLEEKGVAPISLSFYEQKSAKAKEYTDRYADGELPFASAGSHRVHDLAFHTGALILPPKVLEHSRYLVKEANAFADASTEKLLEMARLRRPMLSEEELKALDWHRSALRMPAAMVIDLGTAGVSASYVAAIDTPGSNFFKNTIDLLYFNAEENLKLPQGVETSSAAAAVYQSMQGAMVASTTFNNEKAEPMWAVLEKVLGTPESMQEYNAFVADYLRAKSESDPRFQRGPEISSEEACRETTTRLRAIREAAVTALTP